MMLGQLVGEFIGQMFAGALGSAVRTREHAHTAALVAAAFLALAALVFALGDIPFLPIAFGLVSLELVVLVAIDSARQRRRAASEPSMPSTGGRAP